MSEKKVVMVRMSEEEYEALKIFSFHSGVSMNEVMLRGLRQFLATEGTTKEFDEQLRKARTRYRSTLERLEDR